MAMSWTLSDVGNREILRSFSVVDEVMAGKTDSLLRFGVAPLYLYTERPIARVAIAATASRVEYLCVLIAVTTYSELSVGRRRMSCVFSSSALPGRLT